MISSASQTSQPPPGLFRNHNFVLLWLAYGISAMGDHISEMAILKSMDALHAPNLTRLQAMITFMFMLPFFLFGPINGLIADWLPRRGLMIAADLIRAVIMLNFGILLATFGDITTVGPFIPLLMVGLFAALFSPARSALLPTLIHENQLIPANAITSGLGVIATMIAVLIGGYLAQHFAPQVAFRIDAITFVGSAVLLFCIRPPRQETTRHRAAINLAAIAEGVRYLREHRRVAQLTGIGVIVWFAGSAVRSTIPALVRDVYLPPGYEGLFSEIGGFQARLGLGLLTGALILTVLGNALRSEIAITWSLVGIAFSFATLAFSVFAPLPNDVAYHVGGFAVIVSGMFGAGVMASYSALLQRIVPNRIRGRLFGVQDLCTVAGLLLATGAIGIPNWQNVDAWVGWILVGVTFVVGVTAFASFMVRMKSHPLRPALRFCVNLNEFYCKWWFRLRREGICTVPNTGPVVIVSNHTSSIDPLLLVASIPHRVPAFLIAKEYYNVPIGGHVIRLLECIPVKRDGQDAAGTKAALRHLKQGKLLGIFIEGRIPRPGEIAEAKDGAALLALHTNATVVPAHISGTRWHGTVVKAFLWRHRAVVRFGRPISLSQYAHREIDKETLARISAMLLDRIRELAPEESTGPSA